MKSFYILFNRFIAFIIHPNVFFILEQCFVYQASNVLFGFWRYAFVMHKKMLFWVLLLDVEELFWIENYVLWIYKKKPFQLIFYVTWNWVWKNNFLPFPSKIELHCQFTKVALAEKNRYLSLSLFLLFLLSWKIDSFFCAVIGLRKIITVI